MRIILQRKVEIWIEESYDLKDESEIQGAIDYEISPVTTEVLWETQQDTGDINIYDEHYNKYYPGKIKLYNRDGADLYLVKTNKKVDDSTYEWYLDVDKYHLYCLEYMRFIGKLPFIESIDPCGGPLISVGDTFNNGKYTVIQINGIKNIWIKEE